MVLVYQILDIVTFALLDVEYVCVCMKVSDLCFGMHLSYLEIADPSLLDFQYLEPLFLSLILSNFSFVLGGELSPVLVSLSSPEVEIEGVRLDRIVYTSGTTDFHHPEKGSKKPEIY